MFTLAFAIPFAVWVLCLGAVAGTIVYLATA